MNPPLPPAMRLKSRWFSADGTPAAKGPEEQGGAMAFITFRVAVALGAG